MKLQLFRNQRNAFITGFIMFLALVIYRVNAIVISLHKARQSQKEAKKE